MKLVYVVYECVQLYYSSPLNVYLKEEDAIAHCKRKGLVYKEMEVEE